jgi:hypothetical protein
MLVDETDAFGRPNASTQKHATSPKPVSHIFFIHSSSRLELRSGQDPL